MFIQVIDAGVDIVVITAITVAITAIEVAITDIMGDVITDIMADVITDIMASNLKLEKNALIEEDERKWKIEKIKY